MLMLDPRRLPVASSGPGPSAGDEPDPQRSLETFPGQKILLAAAGYPLPRQVQEAPCRDFARVCLKLESVLPVAAHVVDPFEVYGFALAGRIFQELNGRFPLLWPRASATILDNHNEKTLRRYGIRFPDLFLGAPKLLESLGLEGSMRQTLDRLDQLARNTDSQLAELSSLIDSGEALEAMLGDVREKMLYQIRRLRERFRAAAELRLAAARRQIERACDALTPCSDLQERRLGALHFIVRYSSEILRTLYEKLDVCQHKHQLIDAG